MKKIKTSLMLILIFLSATVHARNIQLVPFVGDIDVSSREIRKSALIKLEQELLNHLALKNPPLKSEIDWSKDEEKKVGVSGLMDLMLHNKRYRIILAHQNVQNNLSSFRKNFSCAIQSSSLKGELICLMNLTANLFWLAKSKEDLDLLRANTDILIGRFNISDFVKDEQMLTQVVGIFASSIFKLNEAALNQLK
jgi:hypothetical protein